jgi:hypothetical protein
MVGEVEDCATVISPNAVLSHVVAQERQHPFLRPFIALECPAAIRRVGCRPQERVTAELDESVHNTLAEVAGPAAVAKEKFGQNLLQTIRIIKSLSGHAGQLRPPALDEWSLYARGFCHASSNRRRFPQV